jgi:hypothetical protein
MHTRPKQVDATEYVQEQTMGKISEYGSTIKAVFTQVEFTVTSAPERTRCLQVDDTEHQRVALRISASQQCPILPCMRCYVLLAILFFGSFAVPIKARSVQAGCTQ